MVLLQVPDPLIVNDAFRRIIGHNWLNWAKIVTRVLEVVESCNKRHMMYFVELSNFYVIIFFLRPLVFEIIEIIG